LVKADAEYSFTLAYPAPVPLAASARWLAWANHGLQGVVGIVTVAISSMTIYLAALYQAS
jgi:hypothetical protein